MKEVVIILINILLDNENTTITPEKSLLLNKIYAQFIISIVFCFIIFNSIQYLLNTYMAIFIDLTLLEITSFIIGYNALYFGLKCCKEQLVFSMINAPLILLGILLPFFINIALTRLVLLNFGLPIVVLPYFIGIVSVLLNYYLMNNILVKSTKKEL